MRTTFSFERRLSRSSDDRANPATVTPSAAKADAISRPMPRLAPVTKGHRRWECCHHTMLDSSDRDPKGGIRLAAFDRRLHIRPAEAALDAQVPVGDRMVCGDVHLDDGVVLTCSSRLQPTPQ